MLLLLEERGPFPKASCPWSRPQLQGMSGCPPPPSHLPLSEGGWCSLTRGCRRPPSCWPRSHQWTTHHTASASGPGRPPARCLCAPRHACPPRSSSSPAHTCRAQTGRRRGWDTPPAGGIPHSLVPLRRGGRWAPLALLPRGTSSCSLQITRLFICVGDNSLSTPWHCARAARAKGTAPHLRTPGRQRQNSELPDWR